MDDHSLAVNDDPDPAVPFEEVSLGCMMTRPTRPVPSQEVSGSIGNNG